MDEKQLQMLWDLNGKKGGFKDFDEFKSLMSDNKSRQVYFDHSNKDLGFKDYSEFEETLGVKKKDNTTVSSQAPTEKLSNSSSISPTTSETDYPVGSLPQQGLVENNQYGFPSTKVPFAGADPTIGATQLEDVEVTAKKLDNQPLSSERLNEILGAYKSSQGVDTNDYGVDPNRDNLRQTTKEEIAHNALMDTPTGKVLGHIAYVGSKATKGVIDVVKGANGLIKDFAKGTGDFEGIIDDYESATDKGFEKLDKASQYGLTKGDVGRIEDNGMGGKAMQNLGGVAEFAPTGSLGKVLKAPAMATFFLQGLGAAKDETKKLRENGTPLKPAVEKAYEYVTASVNGLLFGELSNGILGKQPLGLRQDIIGKISADVLKEATEKKLTGEAFNQLLTKSVAGIGEKSAQALYDMAKTGTHALKTLEALNAASYLTKKGADELNDKPVFNETLKDFTENAIHTVGTAAMFGLGGGVGALTKYSGYKNAVVESLMKDPSPENMMRVKEDINKIAENDGWNEQEVKETQEQVGKIAEVTSKLKSTEKAIGGKIPSTKVVDAVDLINGRTELQEQLKAVQEGRKNVDESVSNEKNPNEEYLENKIDQANDRLNDIITGGKTKYIYDKEADKYFKEKKGERTAIDESRYELEENEKPFRDDNKEVVEEVKVDPIEEVKINESSKTTPEQEKAIIDTGKEIISELSNKTDKELNDRWEYLEDKLRDPNNKKEFNEIDTELEKRERNSIFNKSLLEADKSIDGLIDKKDLGVYAEPSDLREAKSVISKYINPKKISESDIKKDFTDALRGNPTTSYADGLKLRESMKLASERGIDVNDLLDAVEKVYTDDNVPKEQAKSVVINMLNKVFKGATKANKEIENVKTTETTQPIAKSADNEQAQVPKTEETVTETGEENVSKPKEYETEEGEKISFTDNDIEIKPFKRIDFNKEGRDNSFSIEIKGENVGHFVLNNQGKYAVIESSEVKDGKNEANSQKGIGTKAYQLMAEYLAKHGKTLRSDNLDMRSKEANALWESLVRKGLSQKKIEGDNSYYVYKLKENVNTPKETIVEGEAKADAEVVQPPSNDGKGNGKEDKGATGKKVSEEFDKLANRSLETDITRETGSNVERETGDVLELGDKEYKASTFEKAIPMGIEVVESAKREFGDSYVGDLLNYLNDGKISFEKKALITVSLENDLRKQLLSDPNNLTLKKQVELATRASMGLLREGATGVALGALRRMARVGYDHERLTSDIFSDKQREGKNKIVNAVEGTTPEKINKEAELQEQAQSDLIEEAVNKGVEAQINEIYKKLTPERKKRADKAIDAIEKFQKTLRSKTYDASIGVPIVIIDAGLTTIKNAIKAGVAIADAIEMGINKIKEKHGKWEKEDEFRKDMQEQLKSVKEAKDETVMDTVKQGLIDAGFGREITVTTKEGKGKRTILDWKKLAGEEGSIDNIRQHVEDYLKKKGNSAAEITVAQKEFVDAYNDLHASIIEKALNELKNLNKEKVSPNLKSEAKRLAELYNFGLFDKESDTYDNIINRAVGLSKIGQEAFLEAKDLAKVMSTILSTKGADGKPLPEIAVKKALNDIQGAQEKLLTKIANSEGNWKYKVANAIGEYASIGQRALLMSLNQIIENPLSGYVERGIQFVGDKATGSMDTPEMRSQRFELANKQFSDIVSNAGDDFGHKKSIFISKSPLLDAITNKWDNNAWHAFTSVFLGRAYLEGADSMHKIALTQRMFSRNAIKILMGKGMSKTDAVNFVSEKLTGESFEQAKEQAKQLIETVNEQAGKDMLPNNQQSVTLLANDITKANLLAQGGLTERELNNAFRAGYTVAGFGMGHESNNLLSEGVKLVNQKIQGKLKDAIKNKQWDKAAGLRLQNALFNNILNPFVGGGTNWTVLTATKMGINPFAYISALKRTKIDVNTESGQKTLREDLIEQGRNRGDALRVLTGAALSLAILAATRVTSKDDEFALWKKKNKVLAKFIDKASPAALIFINAYDQNKAGDKESMDKAWDKVFGVKAVNYFDDAKKVAKATHIFTPKNETDWNEAWGAIGQLTLGKINAPVPSWKVVKDFMDIDKAMRGEAPTPIDYKVGGFFNGAYQGGFIENVGLRPDRKVAMYDLGSGKEKTLVGKDRKRYNSLLQLVTAEHIDARKAELNKLSPSERQEQIKAIATKASAEVLELMSGYNSTMNNIEDDNKTYVLDARQIKQRADFAKDYYKENPNELQEITDEYINDGLSASEAAIKARKEYKSLVSAYTKNRILELNDDGKIKLKEKE